MLNIWRSHTKGIHFPLSYLITGNNLKFWIRHWVLEDSPKYEAYHMSISSFLMFLWLIYLPWELDFSVKIALISYRNICLATMRLTFASFIANSYFRTDYIPWSSLGLITNLKPLKRVGSTVAVDQHWELGRRYYWPSKQLHVADPEKDPPRTNGHWTMIFLDPLFCTE